MEKHSHKDIESLVRLITDADTVVVGVGSGLSSAAGFNHYHWAPALETHLGEFKDYYHFNSPFAGFYLHRQSTTSIGAAAPHGRG